MRWLLLQPEKSVVEEVMDGGVAVETKPTGFYHTPRSTMKSDGGGETMETKAVGLFHTPRAAEVVYSP